MLGLQVDAPFRLIVEISTACLQQLDRMRVGAADEILRNDVVKTVEQALVNEAVEEVQLIGRVVKQVADNIFQHVLLKLANVGKISEADLRLHHPELRRMTRGVAVLGAEGRAEGVDVAERSREGLGVELSADGQGSHLAEEIFVVVDFTFIGLRNVIEIHGRELEHLAGAFSIGSGHDRSVDVNKSALLEELVDRERS